MKNIVRNCSLALLIAFCVVSCASRQAGVMAIKAQSELAVYVRNANNKVHQAENARLELELRLLAIDIQAIIASGAPANESANEIVKRVKQKIDQRDQRLQIWDSTNVSAENVNILLGAIGHYNSTGITWSDASDTVNSVEPEMIHTLIKPKPTPAPMP